MPERILALFSHVPEQREQVQHMLLDAGLIESLVESPPEGLLYQIPLPNEDAVRRLTLAAKLHGVDPPLIRRWLAPTKKELAAAPLLVLTAGGPAASGRHPRADTSYDESAACPLCGAGLVQTSPLKLRKTELPKASTAASIGNELVVQESVAQAMEDAGLRGIRFRPVLSREGNELPWRQLVVDFTMPPMLASTRGMIRGRSQLEQPCRQCGRDGWFNTTDDPFIPAYGESALERMPDAAWSRELFGTGAWAEPVNGKRWLAQRTLIVRPGVYALFTRIKVRGVRWSPVVVQPDGARGSP